jgi:SAM-dependent methyltransferase
MNHADAIQRKFYTSTASAYDQTCGRAPEHQFALHFLAAILDFTGASSVLDVGSGTGEVIRFFQHRSPSLHVVGTEPVDALRQQGHASGIPKEKLVEGDGRQLPFADQSFDFVVEFGVLHHVAKPSLVVDEMLRVARYGVFLSDTNNLGQGSLLGRLIKNMAYWCGLWGVLNAIRTRGKGYIFEPHDGLWYYYTALSHYRKLRAHCSSVHVLNTRGTSRLHAIDASHVAIVGLKKSCPAQGL